MTEQLPTYRDLKDRLPLSSKQALFIQKSRHTIGRILCGQEPRLLCIVGPCSIHELDSALEFALRLKEASAELSDRYFLVMRSYFEKPRSVSGWKGFLYDPFLDGSHAIERGLELSRAFLLELARLEVPAGTEFLDPFTAFYYDDLISWGSIGARTSSSSIHRQLVSGLNIPVGFKNSVTGSIRAAVHGAFSASHPHIYMGLDSSARPSVIRTEGNPLSHIMLRGGETSPNYQAGSVAEALALLAHFQLPPRLLIDCAHDNSRKQYEAQVDVFQDVLQQIFRGNGWIRGVMFESHLLPGKQPFPVDSARLKYGVSITDSCLDVDTLLSLLKETAHFTTKSKACIAHEYTQTT